MANPNDLQRYLNNNGISYRIVEHEPAFTAHDVASIAHVADREYAKVVLVSIDDRTWMAVLRADERINAHLVKLLFRAHSVRLIHEEDLNLLFPDCELGTMPPFGNLYGIPVLLDLALLDDNEMLFHACCSTKSVRMKTEDYRRLVNPLIGRYAQPLFARAEDR